jgi:nitrate/TMAO reductase-like tetraheme cytochrome c subunit
VKRRASFLAAAVFALSGVLLGTPETAIPAPKGWIGTTTEWARGLGLAFAVLNLLLLFYLWGVARRSGLTSMGKQLMFISVAVLPVAVVFFSYSYGMQASETVEACGACHVMEPWVNNLRDPKADTLAAVHYKNRFIQENHCYTCHSDYGMFGTGKAKVDGLGHIVHYTFGSYEHPIRIASPYPNTRCLYCHGESQKFQDPAKHPPDVMPDLMSGKTSCLDCHGPAHPPQEGAGKKASLAHVERSAS